MSLPGGTVTFLFTDIEGSTKLWEEHTEAMRQALARHDALLRQAIESNNGHVFKTVGDAFCAAFATAPDALNAALATQLALHAEVWPDALSLRVRMALHTGAAELRDGDYFGQPLNRIARLLGAGHGGQVLLSLPTEELVRDTLPSHVSLKTLGEHRLRDLGRPETVFQLLHPDLPSDFAPLKSLDNPDLPNNLPQQVTSFIGREKEIEAVKTLLAKTRLLTLTGSGGCGKTRLGLQVAAEVLENYQQGVWLVELASLSDPTLVPQTVALALSVTEEPDKSVLQTLVTALKDRKMLLVLDNCEHLLAACAGFVDTLIRACPDIRVLASSREGLGITGEQMHRIPSLSLPDTRLAQTVQSVSQYEAVRLFVDRASAVLPAFVVTNANAPALASVCHRLDGIPLALELAAARVRSLSVEEINSKLDNRFRLLTGGSRTALPRQQTLRALIDWSYDLLTGQEQYLLARLSIFAGGWTLEAAEDVCSGEGALGEPIEEWEVLDLLTSLADKSLVIADVRGAGMRYRLLETLRQYARDRLIENAREAEARTHHENFYFRLAKKAEPYLTGGEQGTWLDLLQVEHDNLRAALEWCAQQSDYERRYAFGVALEWFWRVRGIWSDGCAFLEAALSADTTGIESEWRARAFHSAGILAWIQGNSERSVFLLEQSLKIQQRLGNKSRVASILRSLGMNFVQRQDYIQARKCLEESLLLHQEEKDNVGIGGALINLGEVARCEGRYGEAQAYLEEALALWLAMQNWHAIAVIKNNLARIACAEGDYTSANALATEGLGIRQRLKDQQGLVWSLQTLASVAAREGKAVRAARLSGACDTLCAAIPLALSAKDRAEQDHTVDLSRDALETGVFEAARAEGRAMTIERAITYALESSTA